MNTAAVKALVKKDLRVVFRSKAVLLPMIIVPALMLVLVPAGIGIAFSFVPIDKLDPEDFDTFLKSMPPSMLAEIEGLDERQRLAFLMLGYLFAPMFLIIPLMMASVIAADSFAGERERGTLEALLYSPLSDDELFLAKALSAWVPAVLVSVLGMVLYCTTANIAAWPAMQRVFLPNTMWLLLAFWVAPAAAAVGLSVTVIVSARVKTLQEAFQLSGMVVIPVVVLMLGQIAGVLYLSNWVAFGLGVVLWAVAAGALKIGGAAFSRTEVLASK
jgi:ABC-type Na+ efflux pump permease subunit